MKWLAFVLLGSMIWFMLSCFSASVGLAENDTATSGNILPNAETPSSGKDNFDLPGVDKGTGALTNNSTHNGFTITCETEVNNSCGTAFNGELEASYQMKVSAGDTLVGVAGVEGSTTYTATQRKLDGGIQLNSYFSIQNCEDNNSAYTCGQSAGADDSYKLHIKIKDAQGNTLAQMTTTRLEDAGYNANSRQFQDNLVYNGTGGASYEWYWEGYDGSLSTSASNRGPNLLGAKLLLDFPIDDHEPLSVQEIEDINEALDTVDLTENEIYDIISGLESKIEEEFRLTGNLEEGTRLEISLEETGLTFEIASQETGAIVMESSMVQQTFGSVIEEKPIETLKEEMVAMVREEMPFMEMMEELSPPPAMEEPPEEEPKAMSAGPMIEEETTKEEEPSSKEPAAMEMAAAPSKEKENVVESKNEQQETKEEESSSEAPATSVVSKQDNTKQKKIQSKKTVKPKLEKVMAKVDEKVKNPLKNLQLKNLIKMDAMVEDQLSLDSYNVAFYVPKDIYLEQLNLVDNRLIYANVSLASYTDNDIIGIKARKLGIINNKKQQLLNELEILRQ